MMHTWPKHNVPAQLAKSHRLVMMDIHAKTHILMVPAGMLVRCLPMAPLAHPVTRATGAIGATQHVHMCCTRCWPLLWAPVMHWQYDDRTINQTVLV